MMRFFNVNLASLRRLRNNAHHKFSGAVRPTLVQMQPLQLHAWRRLLCLALFRQRSVYHAVELFPSSEMPTTKFSRLRRLRINAHTSVQLEAHSHSSDISFSQSV
jgi:hypothetical protein